MADVNGELRATIKRNIRRIMMHRDIDSLYGFHAATQVSYGAAWRMWSGRGLPDLETCCEFAKALGYDRTDFLKEILKRP